MLILYIRKWGKSVTIPLETKVFTVLVAKYWLQFSVNFHSKHHLICEFLRHANASHRAETFPVLFRVVSVAPTRQPGTNTC